MFACAMSRQKRTCGFPRHCLKLKAVIPEADQGLLTGPNSIELPAPAVMITIDSAEISWIAIRAPSGIAGLLCLLLAVGCSIVKSPPSEAPTPQIATLPSVVEPVARVPSPAPSPPTEAQPQSSLPPAEAARVAPAPSPAPVPSLPTPAAKPPPAVAPKPSVAEPAKKERTVPDIAKQAPASLDLKALEQRLKDTNAIGVLTKIALKNQVDDLLDQFRAFYQGKLKTTLSELRRSYDLLVLKVLSLLQESDPSLASAIVASREAIWGILADRARFETI